MSAGKTTLTTLLEKELHFPALTENFADNPYLADFFHDMKRWAFLSQMHFLNERKKQVDQINSRTSALVLDRSVYEDFGIFATNLYKQGFISEENFETYKIVYKKIVDMLPPPQLFIYLQASLESLIERTKRRGREYEASININYLNDLNQLYNNWAETLEENFPNTKILRIETDSLNFADNPEDAQFIVQKVREALK